MRPNVRPNFDRALLQHQLEAVTHFAGRNGVAGGNVGFEWRYHTVKLRFHADTDARRQCGLGCGWQCWYRGGVASLGISFAGLPKLEKQKKKEPDASDSFKVLSEDDHRNS